VEESNVNRFTKVGNQVITLYLLRKHLSQQMRSHRMTEREQTSSTRYVCHAPSCITDPSHRRGQRRHGCQRASSSVTRVILTRQFSVAPKTCIHIAI